MQFEIKNRWNSEVIFTCELSADMAQQSYRFQLGFAVPQAVKAKADLRDADLRGADSWVPKIANIHQSIYNAASKENALDMGTWHNSCGTAHCRAGWVVTLAGEGGRVMEGLLGTPAAAALIYQASDPALARVPNFYCENAEALADMKRLADEEAARVSP